jgi:hypothetical protein
MILYHIWSVFYLRNGTTKGGGTPVFKNCTNIVIQVENEKNRKRDGKWNEKTKCNLLYLLLDFH